jgi:hypothetical protein
MVKNDMSGYFFKQADTLRVVAPREPSFHKSLSGSLREVFINSIEAFTSL